MITKDNFVTFLDNKGIIKITGLEARDYLQGQLSCDVKESMISPQLGCCCSSKGRVQSIFCLFKQCGDYFLAMPLDIVTAVITRLKHYAIFSRVKITDASDSISALGVKCAQLPAIDDSNITVFQVMTNHYELYGKRCHLTVVFEKLKLNGAIVGEDNDWKLLYIQNKLPNIHLATYEKFLPHDLNLPQLKAVDFDKGCYTGQEIIARVHYRGKPKQHLQQASVDWQMPVVPGDIVTDDHQTNVGQVVESCLGYVLIVLKDAAVNSALFIKKAKLTLLD